MLSFRLGGEHRLRRGLRLWLFFFFAEEVAEALHNIKGNRNKEDRDNRGGEHAANDRRSQYLARNGACSERPPQGHAAKNESKCSHQDWPQSQSGAGEGRFDERLSLVILKLSEFHDENGVL